jgi:hypothetical protein
MRLVVHDIDSAIYQTLTPEKNTIVQYVRPHLYIRNNPAGSLKVQIAANDGTIIAESDEVLISDITDAPEFHGYVSFEIGANLKGGTPYRFYIAPGTGYSFDPSEFCGVCNDYDFRRYDTESAVSKYYRAPLDLEIWELTKK